MFTERLDSHLESSLQRSSHCSGGTSQAVRWECAAQNEGNVCGNWCLELHNTLTIFLFYLFSFSVIFSSIFLFEYEF